MAQDSRPQQQQLTPLEQVILREVAKAQRPQRRRFAKFAQPKRRQVTGLYGAPITKGEGPGHPFRGNQYTRGVGGAMQAAFPNAAIYDAGKPSNLGSAVVSLGQHEMLLQLAERYPEVAKEIQSISFNEERGNCSFDPTNQAINLTSHAPGRSFKDPAVSQFTVPYRAARRNDYSTSPEYRYGQGTAAHEFGHAVDAHALRVEMMQQGTVQTSVGGYVIRQQDLDVPWWTRSQKLGDMAAMDAALRSMSSSPTKYYPSKYGQSDDDEFVAEAFAAREMHTPMPAGARRILKYEDQLATVKFDPSGMTLSTLKEEHDGVKIDYFGPDSVAWIAAFGDIEKGESAGHPFRGNQYVRGVSGGDGKGTPDDPIHVHGNLDLAARLIAQGKSIRLDTKAEASMLLSKMHEMAQDMKRKGKDAPDFDLCRITVPGTNLFCQQSKGIPRAKMPQLKGPAQPGTEAWKRKKTKDPKEEISVERDYMQALNNMGVKITETTLPASHLKATQSELNGVKVGGMMRAIEAGKMDTSVPIFVTRDGYVIDGHHRWAAMVGEGLRKKRMTMPVRMLDMDIGQAIDFTNQFTIDMGIAQQSKATMTGPSTVRKIINFLKGESSGHPFRGNQYTRGISGGGMPGIPHDQQAAITAFAAEKGWGTQAEMAQRLVDMYDASVLLTPHEYTGRGLSAYDEGMGWYGRVSDECRRAMDTTGMTDFRAFLGMVAATSSNSAWETSTGTKPNLECATRLAKVLQANPEITITNQDVAYWNGSQGVLRLNETTKKRKEGKYVNRMPTDLSEYVGKHRLSDLPADVVARVCNAAYRPFAGSGGATGWPNMEKAVRIYRGMPSKGKTGVQDGGRPSQVLSGNKIRNFYLSLSSRGKHGSVIDRHMMRVATGDKHADYNDIAKPDASLKRAPKHWVSTAGSYPLFDAALREGAKARHVSVSDFQAVVWYAQLAQTPRVRS